MERLRTVIILCMIVVWLPSPLSPNHTASDFQYNSSMIESPNLSQDFPGNDVITGTLDPIDIEHIGTIAGASEYHVGRTDVESAPGYEAWLPVGSPGNLYSADCDGGYFLVGAGGSADFSSPSGTISLWIKWDVSAPHGRFWGQDGDFETRWSSNRLMLDWGSDNTFQGIKSDWVSNHWYFIAITWDETANSISLYWGDEDNGPIHDSSTSSWYGTLSGYHSENDIMNSRAHLTDQVDGHVDEFRYYSVQRNLEELRSDYNVTLTGTEPGLAHYYRFEDDLEDSTGSENLVPIYTTSFSHDVYVGVEEWRAEQIEVNIRNLRRLSVLNGSFETGVPGINVDTNWPISTDGQYYADGWSAQREVLSYEGRQRASYVDTGLKYITLENEGYAVGDPIDYRHYNGTNIFWFQAVYNDLSVEEFDFSMNFLYQRGPIGQNFTDIFEFTFEILNGSSVLWNWSIDPTNITQRGVWYTVGPLDLDIPNAPTIFEARLSLKVSTSGDYVEISETDSDLDGDAANGQFVTFMIDDISLVESHSLSCEEVQLEVALQPLGAIPLSGAFGTSSLFVDFRYWLTATIPFTFSSNTSVSFEYSARVSRMTKPCNSSSTTGLKELGVTYSAYLGESIELSLFTYIQSYPVAEDIGFKVYFPSDWENASILDPFGFDVTDQSTVNSHYIEVPSGIVDSVGWWQITFDSTNFAQEITTQVQESSVSWRYETLFWPGDKLRCEVTIGTGVEALTSINDLELIWYNPLGAIWETEIINNNNSSTLASTGNSLGPSNSTTGLWSIIAFWSNGSEVAFGYATFEVHHRLNIFAQTPNIEIESTDEFTVAVVLYDQDNGNPILSDAVITGNWSYLLVTFNPNLAKGWWEADFNVADQSSGEYVIVVEVSMPFYQTSSTTVTIRVPDVESLSARLVRASFLGAFVVVIFMFAIAISRRFYKTIMSKRNIELMILEGRIDDAKNLIGLLVIHRGIGLPVYSNILKGGFQEALLSSFISAISQFRSEFSMDEPTWTAIPITEVITAVQTEALICAIITVEAPSNRQKTQLETFSREVGGLYDHEDDTIRRMVRTPTLTDEFDSIFESYFDGQVMKRYVGVKKSLPKNLHAVSTALDAMDIDHGVPVDAIIKATSLLGYSERRAYNMVLEAVDNGHLIAAEKKLPSPIKLVE